MENLSDFFKALEVAGIPLLAVLIGAVQVIKGFMGTQGKASRAVCVVLGVVLGVGYWISANGAPVAFPEWFTATVFGLALGIVAYGLFDTAVDVGSKALAKIKLLK